MRFSRAIPMVAMLGGLVTMAVTTTAAAQPSPPEAPAQGGALQGSLDTPAQASSCAPPKLFRTTFRNVSPGLAAADRAAQPRHLWRLGEKYLRSEESPDPVRGDMTIAIIAEPDIWTFNRATREGRHSVDPGPVLRVQAPILPPMPGLPPPLRALEFGCEAVFVALHAPQQQRIVPWGSAQASLHTATMGEHSVAVLMDMRRNAPLMLSYLLRDQVRFVIRYDEYRHGLPDQPGLFEPPKNLKMIEAGMEPTARPLGPAPPS